MNEFIPIVIEPYPDELLYSWIQRLAKANGLSPLLFFETYFGKEGCNKQSKVPADIRRGFSMFYDVLGCDIPASELYLQLTTIPFELIAFPQKLQTRIINNVFRKMSKVNYTKTYFFTSFNICPECVKEDIERFGESYIHRSHQLTGVNVCHKHHVHLFNQKTNKSCIYDYDFENMSQLASTGSFEEDCRYADYTYKLLSNNIQSNSNDIIKIVFETLQIKQRSKKEVVAKINEILNTGKESHEYSVWSRNDAIFPITGLIKLLMRLYPDPQDVINIIPPHEVMIEKHCDICNKNYYTTEQAIEDGWGCTFCDDQIDEKTLIKRLVKISGNKEYVFKGFASDNGDSNIMLHHKSCGQDITMSLGNFIFTHTRCNCGQQMQRKEADRRMKAHPKFKLIEFKNASSPATFLHTECGQRFTVITLKDFLEIPKCRCCEIPSDVTQEIFEQEVRDLVGDEYTVVGEVKTRNERVKIKHNTCGCVYDFKIVEFLSGSRCPQCYCKTSDKQLKMMLEQYADDRYSIIGHDTYRVILYDHKEDKEIRLRSKHVVQEIIRPTPSELLPTDKAVDIGKSTTRWDAWYQLCIEYKKEFGHLCPGRAEKYKGHALGDWCSHKRIEFNKGLLSEEEIQLLKDIDFVFDAVFHAWNKRFEEYKAYVAETGDMNPIERMTHNGNKVGTWVRNQRHEEAKGKLNPAYKEILLNFNSSFFDRRQPQKQI